MAFIKLTNKVISSGLEKKNLRKNNNNFTVINVFTADCLVCICNVSYLIEEHYGQDCTYSTKYPGLPVTKTMERVKQSYVIQYKCTYTHTHTYPSRPWNNNAWLRWMEILTEIPQFC